MEGKSLNGCSSEFPDLKIKHRKKGEKLSKHLQDSDNYVGPWGSPGEINA